MAKKIEPTWYVPVIPMVLVNGASGIGTGWSTDVPNYDPLAIIDNLRSWLKKQKMKPMRPWYRGFNGAIEPIGKGSYYSWGHWFETDNGVEIKELPVRKWTQDYKEFLHTMLPCSDVKAKLAVQDVREYHTDRHVHFSLKMNQEEVAKAKEQGVEHVLKLWSTIKKYKNVLDIMDDFAKVRLTYYGHRKRYLIDKLTLERDLLNNRARFIKYIVEKKLHINNRKKADVVKDLTRLKFQKFGDTKEPRTGFEYLLIMQIASLTKERKEELERMAKEKAAELEQVKKTSPQSMWLTDLSRLENGIQELYAAEAEGVGRGQKRKATGSSGGKRGRGSKRGGGKAAAQDE